MLEYFFEAMAGKVIAQRYRLGELLGEGGIGFVARAEQLSVGRQVAIKFLRRSTRDAVQVARFKTEARALAALEHPACLTLHDFDYSPELECYYMVTELVEGIEFGEAVVRGMALSEALRIVSHVCDALAAAHARGVLHQDLKPPNVMVTASRVAPVKLLDFGTARLYRSTFDAERSAVTKPGYIHGTPAYMSPEQCLAEPHIGPASDIYSVGAMLYELCTGRVPFNRDTTRQILLSHVHDEVPPLDAPGIPGPLEDLIARMLAKDPAERPQDLYEVRATLERAADLMCAGGLRPLVEAPLPRLTPIKGLSRPIAPPKHDHDAREPLPLRATDARG